MRLNSQLRWVWWVGIFLILFLPLLDLPPWFSPPDWGKSIVFRIILSILISFFFYQILTGKGNATFSATAKNAVFQSFGLKLGVWLLLALLGIFFLATIFSLDPHFSLWGNPYRSGGFLNFAFYIIFAILAFLVLEKNDWQKVWDFAILIGILVSIVAIFQQFGILSQVFIPFYGRPPSTVGGPIFLAIYLLLLSFLTLSFGIETKNLFKKIFYFFSLLLFFSVAVFITQTRAVIIGFGLGFFYFIFAFPVKKRSTSLILKGLAGVFLILAFLCLYYVNTQEKLPEFIQENRILSSTVGRLSIKSALQDPRVSGWKVSWQALKNRPILDYGPENFAIGFDKFYDPKLPGIESMPGADTGWWDRAHNVFLDIPIQAGVLALIIYLALFGVLFWQLQKLKSSVNKEYSKSSNPSWNSGNFFGLFRSEFL